MANSKFIINGIYETLFKRFGSQHWWPAQTRFEVIVGAILTQNTNWGNVEKALNNLKQHKRLNPQSLIDLPLPQLAGYIKPAGYFNVKANRLKNFLNFLFQEYDGNLNRMGREVTATLRRKLLDVNGIGPETADSILLYAFKKPVFVIDAYTKRVLSRHNLINPNEVYDTIQKLFMAHLKEDISVFNEYHALIVRIGKDYCKTKPRCESCPLNQKKFYA